MVTERLSMRKVLEVLRLKLDLGLGLRPIAASVGVGRTTVTDYLNRFATSGLSWPLPVEMDEAQLERKLFPPTSTSQSRVAPDLAAMEVELKHKGVTLALLWSEYQELHGERAYQFSRFCQLHAEWRQKKRLWMRQYHKAGEKLFVDYSGDGLRWVDPLTGEVHEVKLFVAALGASSYTFACATPNETLPCFLACHVAAFEFLGGVPEAIVCDNLRSGVTKADRYEPEVNQSYAELATHYGTCVLPTKPRAPREKAKVEVAVLVAQRWIVAKLRKRTFHSLMDLNNAVEELLEVINNKLMRHLGVSRAELFKNVDQPVLKLLPANRYEHASWKTATVHPDYHVQVDKHWYSVPYQHRGEEVKVRITATTVEVLLYGKRIASHAKSHRQWHYTTLREHMPPHHVYVKDSTVENMRSRASQVGPSVVLLFEQLMKNRPHPEQAIRGCQGILAQLRPYGAARVDAACKRALLFGTLTVQSVKSILRNGLDAHPPEEASQNTLPHHENIRGAGYYS